MIRIQTRDRVAWILWRQRKRGEVVSTVKRGTLWRVGRDQMQCMEAKQTS